MSGAVVRRGLQSLYLSGSRCPRQSRPVVGQPRVVAVVTGGGGAVFQSMLREPGASSCLLEGVVPYHKESCLSFLGRHGRRDRVGPSTGVGFCSRGMAALLAESARDRALELTPLLAQWPDCLGVSVTATIVSHYTRRGDYRAYAGSASARQTASYEHTFVKGQRDRAGEDDACALLAFRALFDAADVVGDEIRGDMATHGVRLEEAAGGRDAEPVNHVGERASGVEKVPERIDHGWAYATQPTESTRDDAVPDVTVLVPGYSEYSDFDGQSGALPPMRQVSAPARALPSGAIIVLSDPQTPGSALAAFDLGAEALAALGRRGDVGQYGSWSEPAAPVLFHSSKRPAEAEQLFAAAAARSAAAAKAEGAEHPPLTNWGVLLCKDTSAGAFTLRKALQLYPSATFAVEPPLVTGALDALPAALARGASFVVASVNDDAEAALEQSARRAVGNLPDAFTWLSDVRARWFSGLVVDLDDGSPSTIGVAGVYEGGWNWEAGWPDTIEGGAEGTMRWENGITYVGEWKRGRYHGKGAKMYSRGGGYVGEWVDGRRHGWGTSLYGGKWGYDRWVGPFVDDLPHGDGTMYTVGDPVLAEFDVFDSNGDGVLSREEVVGRLCGEFGAERADAEKMFEALDDNGNGTVELSEFVAHQKEVENIVGKRFERREDQRPVFSFVRGEPAGPMG